MSLFAWPLRFPQSYCTVPQNTRNAHCASGRDGSRPLDCDEPLWLRLREAKEPGHTYSVELSMPELGCGPQISNGNYRDAFESLALTESRIQAVQNAYTRRWRTLLSDQHEGRGGTPEANVDFIPVDISIFEHHIRQVGHSGKVWQAISPSHFCVSGPMPLNVSPRTLVDKTLQKLLQLVETERQAIVSKLRKHPERFLVRELIASDSVEVYAVPDPSLMKCVLREDYQRDPAQALCNAMPIAYDVSHKMSEDIIRDRRAKLGLPPQKPQQFERRTSTPLQFDLQQSL